MKYYTASVLVKKIEEFKRVLRKINIQKADAKRNGRYTIALQQLEDLQEGRLELEILSDPDNTLRNIMMLAPLDATDTNTKK
jgi:hypothetical protein